jgi:hypothetical protein
MNFSFNTTFPYNCPTNPICNSTISLPSDTMTSLACNAHIDYNLGEYFGPSNINCCNTKSDMNDKDEKISKLEEKIKFLENKVEKMEFLES